MSIEPMGVIEKAPAFVEKRVWRVEEDGEAAAAKEALEAAVSSAK
jgi:hypothetical protein